MIYSVSYEQHVNNAVKHKMELHDTPPSKSGGYLTNNSLNGDNKYTANDICKMIEFLVDSIHVRTDFWHSNGKKLFPIIG